MGKGQTRRSAQKKTDALLNSAYILLYFIEISLPQSSIRKHSKRLVQRLIDSSLVIGNSKRYK